MRIENLISTGYPSHLKGIVKEAIKSLMKKEYVIYYNKTKEAIQLNFRKYPEIMEILKNGD